MNSGVPNFSLQRTAGLRFSRFVAQWPAAAEFLRWTPTRTSERGVDGAGLPSEAHFWDLKLV